MSDLFKITQLAVYNPQRLDDNTFNALFVVRTKLFDYLIDQIKEESTKSIPQHHLIIGARGMGKSMLLKRLEVELKSHELIKTFIPILYTEEQYNITSLNDLWLNSLDKLADVMDCVGNDKLVREIDSKVDVLQNVKNVEGHEDEAYKFFTKITSELGKRPVLLIDNINFLFKRLDKSAQHWLRNILSQKSAPIIIAASPVKVNDVLEYGAPFYDAFQINYLQKLNEKELLQILNNLAKLTGSTEVISEIGQKKSRLRVINQLTGGNPRTSVILFKLISRGFSNSIVEDLDALLDDITPLYKARFEEELPSQLQNIMNAIAINWDPVDIEKLRVLTSLNNSQLSPQLKRLVDSGWITKKSGFKTKGKVYEVSERFFNIWYLMRQSSSRHKKQVLYLSRFLESLYGDDINTRAHTLLGQEANKADHIIYNLAVAECTSEDMKKQLIEKCRKDLNSMLGFNPEEKKELDSIVKQYEESNKIAKKDEETLAKLDNPYLLMIRADIDFDNDDFAAAAEKYKKALNVDPKNSDVLHRLGYIYQVFFKRYVEADTYYKKVLKIDTENKYTWHNLGILNQYHFKHYEEAENCYIKALKVDPKYLTALNELGNLYQNHLSRHEESEECYNKALKVDPKYVNAWNGLGYLYDSYYSKYEKSENCYKNALEFDALNSNALNGLGNLYQDQFKEYKKAKELYLLCGKDLEKSLFVVKQANEKWKSLPNWAWKGLINNCASLLGE
jgi:tetratricopeptide (TPR) repeat protein/RNA-binding protein YhbY